MSRGSFPLPEHVATLRAAIAQCLGERQVRLEVSDRGVDHLRCCYRFGLRRSPEQDWVELPIHFQVAERLKAGQTTELERILQSFLKRSFSAAIPATSPPQERC
jgi:hypothetical protein